MHMKQLYTLHKRARKLLMPSPNMDYNQKCSALKLFPLDKQLLLSKCVLMQKFFHGKAPQYLKDLMILLNVFTFTAINNFCPEQGSISLKRISPFGHFSVVSHHLRYPTEVNTFKRNTFQALTSPTSFNICIFMCYCTLFHFPCCYHFNAFIYITSKLARCVFYLFLIFIFYSMYL